MPERKVNGFKRRKGSSQGPLSRAARRVREAGAAAEGSRVGDFFRRVAQRAAEALGSSWAFICAALVVVAWAVTGPLFGFSDTWQLVINTATTIVTFLMVFLIQNAQNRDAKAFHLKLDELIHSVRGARNKLIDLEHCTEEELAALEKEFARLAKRGSAARDSEQGGDAKRSNTD